MAWYTVLSIMLGCTGFWAFCEFLIRRFDKKKEDKDGAAAFRASILRKLEDISEELRNTTKHSVKLELEFMMEFRAQEHEKIMQLAEYYFKDLNGGGNVRSQFKAWLKQQSLEDPDFYAMAR